MLGVNYGPDHDPVAILQHPGLAAISVYAKGEDYHEVIKPRLKEVARWLTELPQTANSGDIYAVAD